MAMGYKTGRPKIDDEYLLGKLKEASDIFGPEITVEEIGSLPHFPSKTAFRSHFGGFNEAKKLLNLFPNANKKGQAQGVKHRINIRKNRKQDTYRKRNPKVRGACLKLRFEIFTRDKFRCIYCGRSSIDGAKLVVDHIIPASKGGLTIDENLATSCHECNMGKNDVLIELQSLKTKTRINR